MLFKGALNHLFQMSDPTKLWYLGQSDVNSGGPTIHKLLITMMSFRSAAAAGFILHDLPLSVSCLSLQVWCLCKVQKASNCHQSVERNSQKSYSHDSAWASHSFIPPPPPPPSPCLSLYPCQTSVTLWPHSSTVSVEQLVSIRPPVLGPHTLAHTH